MTSTRGVPGRPRAGGADLDGFPAPVLVLAPHMDDEALACGRLIAALADAGRAVHVVFATDGARSPAVPAERVAELVAERAREARCAADALGYGGANARFLALPDGDLDRHTGDLTLGVARAWEEVRPATVLMPFRYDRHGDHLALRAAAVACARNAPGDCAIWQYFVYHRWRLLRGGDLRRYLRPEQRVAPDTAAYADRKLRALRCYRSQTSLWARGQRRAILPPARVEEVAVDEEVFARWDPAASGPVVRGAAALWVPLAHRLEPALKTLKDVAAGIVTPARSEPAGDIDPQGGRDGAGHQAGTGGPDGAAERGGGERAEPPEAGGGTRPVRVVVFASPFPLPAEWRFLARLDAHPDLELAGVLCQGKGAGRAARIRDLWRRRGLLAAPLLARDAASALRRSEAPPSGALDRIRTRMRVVPDAHAPDALAWVASLEADVGVVYGGPFLKPALFELPRRGTLGVHHGRLPDYRGKKTVFWAMHAGEASAGVTIQAIDAGLDTGRVVRAGEVPIGRRSYREVSRRVQELGVELLLDALLAGEPSSAARPDRASPAPPGGLYRDPRPADYVRFFLRRLRRA